MSARKRANGEGSLYQRASDGKWVGSVTLPTGKRKAVYGADQKDAREKMRAVLRAVEDGAPITDGRLTVATYLEEWLTTTLPQRVEARRMKPGTLDSYADNLRHHVIPIIGRERLAQLRPAALRNMIAELQRKPSGRKSSDGSAKPLSARTVTYCHAILRAALSDAVRDELVVRNVAELVEPPAVSRTERVPLTRAEATALLTAARATRLYAMWLTLLAVGLRRGECLALRWSDLDLDAGRLTVRRSLQRLRGERDEDTGKRRGRLVEVDPKTEASSATVALPASVVTELREHRQRQRVQRLAAPVWADAELVFTTGAGTALEPRNVNRAFETLRERAGIRHVRLHDLRHAAATFALAAGVDMKTVQAMLRHSRMATTSDLYAHVLEEVRDAGAERIDGFLRELGT